MVEQESVVVEMTEVAGGVEAVGGEDVVAATPADPAQDMWTSDLDLSGRSGGTGPVSDTIRTSMPANGFPQLPHADRGMSVSAGYPQ